MGGPILLAACCGPGMRSAHADESYFYQPAGSGTVWGVLIDTNASSASIASCEGGYVLAGMQTAPPGPGIDTWAVLARLGVDGSLVAHTNFSAEGDHNWATEVIPVYAAGGVLDGFAFAGARYHKDPVMVDEP